MEYTEGKTQTPEDRLNGYLDGQISEIENIVASIYPKDSYYITPQNGEKSLENWRKDVLSGISASALQYKIELHFPEIGISNTKEQHYKIYDLFFRLLFDIRIDTFGKDEIKGKRQFHSYAMGMRTCQTDRECAVIGVGNKGYIHSHLNVGEFGKWGTFCLGSSPLSIDLVDLKNTFTKQKFEVILLSIPVYLQWESLEGIPYKRIEKVWPESTNREDMDDTLKCAIIDQLLVQNFKKDWIKSRSRKPLVKVDIVQDKFIVAEDYGEKLVKVFKDVLYTYLSPTELKRFILGSDCVKYNEAMEKTHIIEKKNYNGESTYKGFQDKEFTYHSYELTLQKENEQERQKTKGFEVPHAFEKEFHNRIFAKISSGTDEWILNQRIRAKRERLGV